MTRLVGFPARFLGGPNDGAVEWTLLNGGKLPDELRCAVMKPINMAEIVEPSTGAVFDSAFLTGIYRLKSAISRVDPEGWPPGSTYWVEASYAWHGYLDER